MALSIGGYSNSIYGSFGSGALAGCIGTDGTGASGSSFSDAKVSGTTGDISGASGSVNGATGKDSANPLENGKSEETTKKAGRRSSPAECETCKHRKYVDGSNEGNVSYKTPTHIDPSAAAGAVASHEGMHVHNAYTKASKEGGRVLQASVSIHTAVCPECGRVYVSGGTTTTRIAAPVNNAASSAASNIFSKVGGNNPYRANEGSLNSILNSGKSLNASA